jgi:proteasome assembly chaperone (PAC2) family protein
MEHVRRLTEPALRNPAVLFAFTGWNDAGDAASASVRALVERWNATPVAEIDPEPFTDFATIRPHVRINDGRRTIVWPTVGVWSASVPGGDVLLVLGPEPSLRWKLFCRQLVGLAEEHDARLAVSLGALLADVPHSRPVQIIGTASDRELIDRHELQRSRYEGPTGIVGVLQDAMTTAGVPTASLWAAVPQYAAQIPSPKAAMALVDRACRLIGSPAPVDVFASGAAEYDARVAALIADDDDLVEYVSRLESLVDDEEEGGEVTGEIDAPEPIAEGDLDPDELVAEVERFLRDRDGE